MLFCNSMEARHVAYENKFEVNLKLNLCVKMHVLNLKLTHANIFDVLHVFKLTRW